MGIIPHDVIGSSQTSQFTYFNCVSNRYENPPHDTEYYKCIIDWGLQVMEADPTGPLDVARIHRHDKRYEVEIWRNAEPLNSFLYLDKKGNILRLTVREVVSVNVEDIPGIMNRRAIIPDKIHDCYVAKGYLLYKH